MNRYLPNLRLLRPTQCRPLVSFFPARTAFSSPPAFFRPRVTASLFSTQTNENIIARPYSFSSDEYQSRSEKLFERMHKEGVDVLILSDLENMYYMTNLRRLGTRDCFRALLLVGANKEILLITKQDEKDEGRANCEIASFSSNDNQLEYFIKTLKERTEGLQIKRIGMEFQSSRCSVNLYRKVVQEFKNSEIVDLSTAVLDQRLIKSDAELEVMRKTVPIVEEGVRTGINSTQIGVGEDQITATIDYTVLRTGGEAGSSPFVSAGGDFSLAHSIRPKKKISSGDLVLLDVSGCHENVKHFI